MPPLPALVSEVDRWKGNRHHDPVRIDRQDQMPSTNGAQHAKVTEALERKRLAEARIKEAEAEKKERDNRLAEANIVERADVELFFSEFFSHLRDYVDQIPDQLGPVFPRQHRQPMVDEVRARLELLLRTMHGWAERIDEIGKEVE